MPGREYAVGSKKAQAKEMNKLIEMEDVNFVKMSEISEISDRKVEQLDEPLPLMWDQTYGLDFDDYSRSFKAQIITKGDLISTEEEIYTATATAYAT